MFTVYMYKNCTFVFQSISQDTCMMPSNVAAPLLKKKVSHPRSLATRYHDPPSNPIYRTDD